MEGQQTRLNITSKVRQAVLGVVQVQHSALREAQQQQQITAAAN